MAVRNAYTIRTPIDESVLQQPITLTSQTGKFSMQRQITLATFLTFMCAIAILVYIMFHEPMTNSGPIGGFLFVAGYVGLVLLIVAPTKTQMAGFHLILPAYHYATDVNREVGTRPADPVQPVNKLIGIEGFTADNGKNKNNSLIAFDDKANTVGEILDLSGNASILIFGSDRRRIVKAADNFYKQIHDGVNFTIDSVSSAQRVEKQLAAKNRQIQMMRYYGNTDPNLLRYAEYQKYILASYVGKEFKAWHQYMIVRAPNRYSIQIFNRWMHDTEVTGLYVNKVRKLNIPEMMTYLRDLYGDDVSKYNKRYGHNGL